jgi:hypothetical protein
VALERDGALYDVELLEKALGAAIVVPGDAWDFHGRVVALGCAGLPELDSRLLRGERPTEARVTEAFAHLAPVDAGAYIHADIRDLARGGPLHVRVGLAREITGQDALIAMPPDEAHATIEVGIGVLIGEDIARCTAAEARHAIIGFSVLCDWVAPSQTVGGQNGLATTRGLRTQVGPYLVGAKSVARIERIAASISIAGAVAVRSQSLADLSLTAADLIAAASREIPLYAGDLIGIGPLPFAGTGGFATSVTLHEKIEVALDSIGTLRGTAVPIRA